MSCEICGRRGCCRSFHSLEEQEAFDNIMVPFKDNMEKKLQDKIDRLSIEEFGGVEYVKYENVRDLIGIV